MDFQERIFNIKNQTEFWEIALEVFNYQYSKNTVYRDFILSLGKDGSKIKTLYEIPFLPVEFFRKHIILTGDLPVEMIFESSGTTGASTGKHFVNDLNLYEESFLKAFTHFYGMPDEFLIAALLPSYTERENSSLVYMADNLIRRSRNPHSGFYKAISNELILTIKEGKKVKTEKYYCSVSALHYLIWLKIIHRIFPELL